MTAKLILGEQISEEIYVELRKKIIKLSASGVIPGLAMILVGDNSVSYTYARKNSGMCKKLGVHPIIVHMPLETTQDQIINKIHELNDDKLIHGLIVHSPLPNHINKNLIVDQISPIKDVDCSHPINVGRMLIGSPYLLPATPAGIQQMLIRSGIDTIGRHVVIVGRGNIVGKPMAAIMIQKGIGAGSTVTVVHSDTKDISHITKQADILITAIGRPRFITSEMVKDGAVVIDAGMNNVISSSDPTLNRFVGDVDFDSVINKVLAITPVPGGVGPMTVCMVISNTIKAAESINQGKPRV